MNPEWKQEKMKLDAAAGKLDSTIMDLRLASVKCGQYSGLAVATELAKKVETHWEQCFDWMEREIAAGKEFDALEICKRAAELSNNLVHAIKWGNEDVELPEWVPPLGEDWPGLPEETNHAALMRAMHPSEDAEDEPDPATDREPALEESIVKLMAMAGTEKNGSDATWSSTQISHGLQRLYPSMTAERIVAALKLLREDGVVKVITVGEELRPERKWVLADDHAAEPGCYDIEAEILEALGSASEGGVLVSWTENQLCQALRSANASVSSTKILGVVAHEVEAQRVWSRQIGQSVYLALDEATLDRTEAHLEAAEAEAAAKVAPVANPEDSETEPPLLDDETFSFSCCEAIVQTMMREPERAWRDYDISGVFELEGNTVNERTLMEALNELVELGFVEYIQPRPGVPWPKEDRWALTDKAKDTEDTDDKAEDAEGE